MTSSSTSTRVLRLSLGLLLLTLPACGLSEYETLMQKAQERAEHFREEQKYLDAPVDIPSEKDKDGHDVAIAAVFFRPPKGIDPAPPEKPGNNGLWRYSPRPRGSDLNYVELAFAEDDPDFARKVMGSYQGLTQVSTPQRKTPWPFDSWEFNGSRLGYSINIYKGRGIQVAAVYAFPKEKRDALRKAIDLSLLTLTEPASAARQRYNQKSPWTLEATPAQ